MPYNGGGIVSENEVTYFVRIANPSGGQHVARSIRQDSVCKH